MALLSSSAAAGGGVQTDPPQTRRKQERDNGSMPNIRIFLGFFIIAAALAASGEAEVVHSTPRSQLKRRQPVIPLTPPPLFVPVLNWEQQAYVKAHNDFRRKVNTPPLVWSASLTASAHAWALQRRGDCNYRQHSPNKQGENIYWMNYKEFSPTDVVQWWFNESNNYDHNLNACKCGLEREGCECGHYLNVIWSTTTQVGCSGAVYCDDQKGVYVVCQYNPSGLTRGVNPFTGALLSNTDGKIFNNAKPNPFPANNINIPKPNPFPANNINIPKPNPFPANNNPKPNPFPASNNIPKPNPFPVNNINIPKPNPFPANINIPKPNPYLAKKQ
ncbi:Pathogenesis-related protein PRMS [Sesamum alatum]|uniref:Pathogenesis-related protein PRMS n=1 Tax=Sesamum alatum TaxID=300844 RepID=A0AAE1XW91_9LAMI|nr:Pathogenesis-related protein PRMS [Sesamum alatum]